MTYILNYENKKYNLANYTQKTAYMFNNFFNMYNKAEDFKEKYTNACSACVVALGIDVVKGIFKDEENLDVNDVFILVEEIAAVYRPGVVPEVPCAHSGCQYLGQSPV